MAFEGNQLAFGNMNAELQEMIEQGGLYENIDPLEATNAPADYPLGESFFANTSPNIASWQTALNVDTTFTRLFVITRVDKNRLHSLQDILIASGTETKRFTRYNLNENWLAAKESGGGLTPNTKNPTNVITNLGVTSATKNFGVFNFVNNITSESVAIDFSGANISGVFKITLASSYISSNASGGAEIICDIAFSGGTIHHQTFDIISMSPTFAANFYIQPFSVVSGKLALGIYKKLSNNPVSVEISFQSFNDKAWDIMNTATVRQEVSASALNLPVQQSIPTQVAGLLPSTSTLVYRINSSTGNNSTGAPNSEQRYKTINYVLSLIPSTLNHDITIYLDAGTYDETVNVRSFMGSGILTIRGGADNIQAPSYKVKDIFIFGCRNQIQLIGIDFYGSGNAIYLRNSDLITINNCTTTTAAASYNGVHVDNCKASIAGCIISNKGTAIAAQTLSTVFSSVNTGGNNNTGLFSYYGSTLIKYGTQPGATQTESVGQGGLIRA